MKMFKRVLAGVMAATMILSSSVGVFAAGSRTGNVTVTGDNAAYYKTDEKIEQTEAYKELQTSEPEVVKMIDKVNAGTLDMKSFVTSLKEYLADLSDTAAKEAAQKVAEILEDKDFVTGFFDLIPVGDVEKNENGNYEVTMNVPGLTEKTVEVKVLHFSTARALWEVIDPKNVDLKAKTVTAEFEDLSPVAIIAKQGTVEAAVSGSQAQGTSPKTEGVSSVWMMWFGAAFVLVAAGSVVIYRKKNCQ